MPSYYSAPFTFDFAAARIDVDAGTYDVDVGDLYTAIKLAQASAEGIINDRISSGSGLVALGPGVQVGLTVELLGSWQLRFPAGNYIARVAGGNLVGGPGGDPIAYTAGVQALLILSAASTVVTAGGSVPTAAQNAAAVRTELATELARVDVATSTRLASAGYTAPPAAATNATAVRTELATELLRVIELAYVHGLVGGSPLQVSATQRQAGTIVQQIAEAAGTVTVERVA
jgi:hypothetical protein